MPFDNFTINQVNRNKVAGVVVGVVTNNEDPERMGRVKVMIPSLSGDDESNWARICTFMSGNDRGGFFLPEVDDEVLVAFEHGNIESPYVVGSLWNGQDALPGENSDGVDDIRLIKSRSGHLILMDDTEGSEKIEIKDGSGETVISFDTNEKKITIQSGQDIQVSSPNGKFSVEANEIELKATTTLSVDSDADINLTGAGKVSIKGAQVSLG